MDKISYLFDGFHFSVCVESDCCAGAWELNDENCEKDDHVDEEEDLVMFEGGQEAQHGHEKKKHSRGHNTTKDGKAGDDGRTLAISGHANQQESYHLQNSKGKLCK